MTTLYLETEDRAGINNVVREQYSVFFMSRVFGYKDGRKIPYTKLELPHDRNKNSIKNTLERLRTRYRNKDIIAG